MKKLFAIMAIMIMVLGASMTCIAAPEAGEATVATEVAVENQDNGSNQVVNEAPAQTSQKSSKKGELSVGAKLGISVGVGCVVSLIIVLVMMGGMNSVREASEADDYYTDENVRIAVSSDRYTHTTRKVSKKPQKS